MILAHLSLQNPNLAARTRLADQFTHTFRNFALQHRIAILRAPDQMILDVVYSVRTCAILSHNASFSNRWRQFYTRIRAKAIRLKGEGFKPGAWK
jgi:hypothetical protein